MGAWGPVWGTGTWRGHKGPGATTEICWGWTWEHNPFPPPISGSRVGVSRGLGHSVEDEQGSLPLAQVSPSSELFPP